MFSNGLREDEDVIEIDAYHALVNEVLEDVIHHGLEGRRGVGESKEHHQWFEQAMICAKCSLPFVALLHLHIVVPPSHVKLCEILCTSQLVNELRDQR